MKKRYGVILLSLMCLVMVLSGCGSGNKSSQLVTNESAMDMAPETPKTESVVSEVAVKDTTGEVQNATGNVAMTLNSSLNRKIIKTGNLDLETKQFDETVNRIFEKVNQIGGFIEGCDISGNSLYSSQSYRNATLTVRIPEKQFDHFINGASEFGNVVRRGIQAQDITDTYVDTETRVKTLEVRRERLLALLEKSGSLDELFKIEQELGNVNYEIETLKGTLGKYDALVDYATIQITVSEVELYQQVEKPQSFGQKVSDAFKNSIRSLIEIGKILVLIMVAFIPYAILLAIPSAIIIKIILKRKKQKRNKD